MNNTNTNNSTDSAKEKETENIAKKTAKEKNNEHCVLSQEDIDALLEVVEEELPNKELENVSYAFEQQVILYDFKRPNKISKKELKAIRAFFDKVSEEIKTNINKNLGTGNTEVILHSVDQLLYSEFLMSLPSPTSFNVVSINSNLSFIVEINPSLIFSYIEKYIGKNIYEDYDYQHLNKKNLIFIKEFNNLIIKSVQNITKKEINEELPIKEINHLLSPNMKNITYMEDVIVMVIIETIIGDVSSFINFCFPYDMFKNIFKKIECKYFPSPKKSNKINIKVKNKLLKDLALNIKIGYKTNLKLKNLLELKPGDIVEINDKNLYLFVKDKFKIKLKDNK